VTGLQLIALAIAASQILRLGFTAAAYSDEDSADDCARFRVARGVELPEKTSSAPFVVLPKEAHLQRTRSNGKFQRLCTTRSYSLARSNRAVDEWGLLPTPRGYGSYELGKIIEEGSRRCAGTLRFRKAGLSRGEATLASELGCAAVARSRAADARAPAPPSCCASAGALAPRSTDKRQ